MDINFEHFPLNTITNSERITQLMSKVFSTSYAKLTTQQLCSGPDEVKIMVLSKDKESNELTELTLIEYDNPLKPAFACINPKMSEL